MDTVIEKWAVGASNPRSEFWPMSPLFQGQLPECQSPNQSGDREVAELPERGAMSKSLVYKLLNHL